MEKHNSRQKLPRAETASSFRDARIRRAIRYAYDHSTAVRQKMAKVGLTPGDVQSARDLERVPVTSKDQLLKLQRQAPPFGGFLAIPPRNLRRICISPGPLYEPEADVLEHASVVMKILKTVRVGRGDVVLNSFTYHLVPVAHWVDEAIRELGAAVIPGGVGSTDTQIDLMKELKVTGYVGTPSFLHTLVSRARERGYDFHKDFKLRKAFLAAEMYPPSLRSLFETELGINTVEGYGTAELGFVSYQCLQRSGMHIDEGFFVEVVEPSTGKQLPAQSLGELVVTSFSKCYCLIRFGTGDLGIITEEPCACRRTSPRILRIAGRVGDAVKVRGMFLHSRELGEALAAFPQVRNFQAVVDRENQRDSLKLSLEVEKPLIHDTLPKAVQHAVQDKCRVRVDLVEFVPVGTISPGEGKVKDIRTWE